jgi:hypothetical protein
MNGWLMLGLFRRCATRTFGMPLLEVGGHVHRPRYIDRQRGLRDAPSPFSAQLTAVVPSRLPWSQLWVIGGTQSL